MFKRLSKRKRRSVYIAAVAVLFLAAIAILLFTLRRPPGNEEAPQSSAPVAESAEPGSTPSLPPRPVYPDDMFITPSPDAGASQSDAPDAGPAVYPGVEDILDGVNLPSYENPGSNPLPIYQDGSGIVS